MRRRPNSGIIRLLMLFMGLVVLAALAVQWGQRVFGPAGLSQTTATPRVPPDLTTQAASTLRGSGVEPTRPGGLTATPGPTLIGPATPADAWANALLDRVIPILETYQPASDRFAWWQGSEANARLTLTDLAVYLGPEPLNLSADEPLQIDTPDPSHPGRLTALAAVLPDQAALILTTNLPFSEWTQVIPNARLCKALLDRITDRAHIIPTGTESYRFRRTLERRKGKE